MIAVFSTLNRFRGAGALQFKNGFVIPVPGIRYPTAILWGLFSAIFLKAPTSGQFGIDILACAVLFFVWEVFGWSRYFATFQGTWLPGGEVKWISKIGERLFPISDPTVYSETTRLCGTFCMAIRGMFILPYFIYLGYRLHEIPLAIGIGALMGVFMGLIYYLALSIARWIHYDNDPIPPAEWLTGLLFCIGASLL